MILHARYVAPVTSPVIEFGAITIENGVITDVGRFKPSAGSPSTDFGDAVICPGFVNAHTHLELSDLAGRVPPGADFIDWLTRLMAVRKKNPPTQAGVERAVQTGIDQSLEHGVTLLGDITRSPAWTRKILHRSKLSCVSYGEIIAIGTTRDRLEPRLSAAVHTEWETERMRIGLSPHAPYTVEPFALRRCAARAKDLRAPVCVHVAETSMEERFTQDAQGPLADYLRSLGVWDGSIPVSRCRPVTLLDQVGLLGPRTLLAHANYVTDEDIERIAASGAGVAYCPRTHAAFQHEPHRFREMIKAGINVCLGTDSSASNPSLSLLDEIRFLHRQDPDLDAADLLRMGTLNAAKALGFGKVAGSIEAGKAADLTVVPLGRGLADTIWTSMLDHDGSARAVYIRGERIL